MIKQIVLETEWALGERILNMSSTIYSSYPRRDGKEYTQADIDKAREEARVGEGKLNAAIAEGYTLFAAIPFHDNRGVNLILYKPDHVAEPTNPPISLQVGLTSEQIEQMAGRVVRSVKKADA